MIYKYCLLINIFVIIVLKIIIEIENKINIEKIIIKDIEDKIIILYYILYKHIVNI